MLERLLSLVGQGGVHSYADLARQLDVSEELLEQMLQDLARMRYIQPVGACDTSKCHHCPVGGSCAMNTRGHVWVLTEKGSSLRKGHRMG
jgi:hypothetical protein